MMQGYEKYDYTKLEKEIQETTALEAIDKALMSDNLLWFSMWSGVAAACIVKKYPEAAEGLLLVTHPVINMNAAKEILSRIRVLVEADGE